MLGLSRVFFEQMPEYRDVFQALLENEDGPIVTRKIKRLFTDVVRHHLHSARPEGRAGEIPRMRGFSSP